MDHTGVLVFGNRTYDFLKRLVQVVLPAFSSLYFGLAEIWDLPAADKVVGTTAVLTTFLGVCLGISHRAYHNSEAAFDGQMLITSDAEGVKRFTLELNKDPEELEDQDSIRFKVGERPNRPLVAEE